MVCECHLLHIRPYRGENGETDQNREKSTLKKVQLATFSNTNISWHGISPRVVWSFSTRIIFIGCMVCECHLLNIRPYRAENGENDQTTLGLMPCQLILVL